MGLRFSSWLLRWATALNPVGLLAAVIVRLGGAGVNVATSPKRSYNMATSLPSTACLPTFKADSGPDRKTMPHRAG